MLHRTECLISATRRQSLRCFIYELIPPRRFSTIQSSSSNSTDVADSATFNSSSTSRTTVSSDLIASPSTSTRNRPDLGPNSLLWRLKHPSRGGQNLSRRHERLSRSVKGKEKYAKNIEVYEEESAEDSNASSSRDLTTSSSSQSSLSAGTASGKLRKGVRTFRGFIVPEEPAPPGSDGMSHCPSIFLA